MGRPHQPFFSEKTRLSYLSSGIKIWTDLFLFCHNPHVWGDGWAESFLIARLRLTSMQRGKNVDPLTFKVLVTSSVAWLKSAQNRAIPDWIIDNFANFAHVMSRHDWPLTSWPRTFTALRCHAFKLYTQFERNRIIHSWVIVILGVGHDWQSFHQTWQGHRAIIAALHSCFRVRISCCIFKRGRLTFEWC